MSSTAQSVVDTKHMETEPIPPQLPPPPAARGAPEKHTVHWFRKGLRLHDNPALREGISSAVTLRCVFIIDPWFASSSNVGINKWRFLLQCLDDLDNSLKKLNSRLFVIRGQPADALPKLFREWGTTALTFEEDPEPYGRVRDHNIISKCREVGITVTSRVSHTLYKLEKIIERNGGKAPLTYHQFQAIIAEMPPPCSPEPTITAQMLNGIIAPVSDDHDDRFGVPTLEELGFETEGLKPPVWIGGETEALTRLERHLDRKAWVASFGRPKMTPQSLLASKTCLSPYLRFGCLSTRLFYSQLTELYKRMKNKLPPLSLHGQILWREFFYCAATRNPNFDRMEGNPICVQIPWEKNQDALAKWANGQTGFPWIDAIMTQLREEGWIHHIARHAVACFLTRGDLWISWEEGMKARRALFFCYPAPISKQRTVLPTNVIFYGQHVKIQVLVFDELLLDADWSVNAGMWMWLSCSSFFQQFFHWYCPVRFGRKTDPNGDFIRKHIPALKNMPTQYIHEPWSAPESVQAAAGCVLGRDYPLPMVDHAKTSQINIARIKQVYAQLAKYKPQGVPSPNAGQSATGISQSCPSPTSIIVSNNQSNYFCSQTQDPQNPQAPLIMAYNEIPNNGDFNRFQLPPKNSMLVDSSKQPQFKQVFIVPLKQNSIVNQGKYIACTTQNTVPQENFTLTQVHHPLKNHQGGNLQDYNLKNLAIHNCASGFDATAVMYHNQQISRNIAFAQQKEILKMDEEEKNKKYMSTFTTDTAQCPGPELTTQSNDSKNNFEAADKKRGDGS